MEGLSTFEPDIRFGSDARRSCLAYYGMLSRIPGLYPVVATSSPVPQNDNQNVPNVIKHLWVGKLVQAGIKVMIKRLQKAQTRLFVAQARALIQ